MRWRFPFHLLTSKLSRNRNVFVVDLIVSNLNQFDLSTVHCRTLFRHMVFVCPLLRMQKERDLKIHFVGDFVENDPLRYFVGGSLRKNKGEMEIKNHTFKNYLVLS